MRLLLCVLALILVCGAVSAETSLSDCLGVLRAFGDQASWFSSCVVIGDGSWVLTSWDAVTEKVGPETTQTVRNPIFISAYTGQAWQCDVKASNKDLNIALLKLPVKGLPSAPLAQMSDFSKAGYCTMGEFMSGDPVGKKWATELMGIARVKDSSGYKLATSAWNGDKAFVTDMDKYKWLFLVDISPDNLVSNGSVAARGSTVVGIYLNKLVINFGSTKRIFGRCAMSTEIARFAGDKCGIPTSTLYAPPAPTVKRREGADTAFQLQARLYTAVNSGKMDAVTASANALAAMFPEDLQVKLMVGSGLTNAGKFDEAIKLYDEAARIDPKYPGLRVNRALALVGLKKRSEAEAELLKATEESPSDTRPLTALTDFYMGDEKTLDKALTYAKKASSAAPQSPAARLLVARIEKRQKNYQAATNEIGEALKMAPDWGDAWFALGSTLEQAGDKPNAEKAYRKMLEKQPSSPTALITLASYLIDEGKKDEPLELIAKLRALTPAPPKEVLDAAKALEDKAKKPAEEPRKETDKEPKTDPEVDRRAAEGK